LGRQGVDAINTFRVAAGHIKYFRVVWRRLIQHFSRSSRFVRLVRFPAAPQSNAGQSDKLWPVSFCINIALNAVRIHGGYGYSTEYDVERFFRDAPRMIVGAGTNEIQRNVIAAQLLSRRNLNTV
jgi:alkylation response protein AidB-like acyl-CoA dehydrogenase